MRTRMRRELLLGRRVIRGFDDFNRADSATLGTNWTPLPTGHAIVSNQADTATGAVRIDVWATSCSTGDQFSQITLASLPAAAGAAPSVLARVADNSNYYRCRYTVDTTTLDLSKSVGSQSTITSTVTTLTAGQTIRLEVQGTTLRAYVDGVLILSATDTSLTAGRGVGFRNVGPTTAFQYDNWSGGDL